MDIHVAKGLGYLLVALLALYSVTTLINVLALAFRKQIAAVPGAFGVRLRALLGACQAFGSDLREFVRSLHVTVRGVPWSEQGPLDKLEKSVAQKSEPPIAIEPAGEPEKPLERVNGTEKNK